MALLPHDYIVPVQNAHFDHALAFDFESVGFVSPEQILADGQCAVLVLNGFYGLASRNAANHRHLSDRAAGLAARFLTMDDERTRTSIPIQTTFPLQRLQKIEHARALDVESPADFAHRRRHSVLADESLDPSKRFSLARAEMIGSGQIRSYVLGD